MADKQTVKLTPEQLAQVRQQTRDAGPGAPHEHSFNLSFRLLRWEDSPAHIAHEEWLIVTTDDGWPTGDVRRVERVYDTRLAPEQGRVLFAAPGRLDVTLQTENRTISLRGEIATGMHSGRPIRFEKIDAAMPAGVHVVVPRITGTAQTLYRLQPQGAANESTCFGFDRDAEIENPLPEPEWQLALVPAIEVPDRIYYQRCPSLEEIKRGQTTTGGQHQ